MKPTIATTTSDSTVRKIAIAAANGTFALADAWSRDEDRERPVLGASEEIGDQVAPEREDEHEEEAGHDDRPRDRHDDVQNVRHGEAPSVCAASVISGSSRVSWG